MSGHAGSIEDSMSLLFGSEGISSVIVGTINPDHLRENVKLAKASLGEISGN